MVEAQRSVQHLRIKRYCRGLKSRLRDRLNEVKLIHLLHATQRTLSRPSRIVVTAVVNSPRSAMSGAHATEFKIEVFISEIFGECASRVGSYNLE
ncbi:hypothetical protein EVAR_79503_1 [Eumeta japonica]|uniref:Uncharacterized protein n=1 Tax=Eumeta variegata TaxID=151549 RepID=A0A4C1UF96_EUMVA|nr:hypothetical protein EVAR_79503_1 [Eumeta japonica]